MHASLRKLTRADLERVLSLAIPRAAAYYARGDQRRADRLLGLIMHIIREISIVDVR